MANMNPNIYTLLSLGLKEMPATQSNYPKRNRKEIVEEMRAKELTLQMRLTTDQYTTRERMLLYMIEVGRKGLKLMKSKTIELAIRMFDYFTLLLAEGYYFDNTNNKVVKGHQHYILLED